MLNFQDMYDTYAADVYRFALWLSGDKFEAEDITSETFIRAWVGITAIRTETLKAYLFTIARNAYLEKIRKRGNHVALSDVYPDPAPELDKLVESHLELLHIKNILQTLPEIDRAAFVMRVQHEFWDFPSQLPKLRYTACVRSCSRNVLTRRFINYGYHSQCHTRSAAAVFG
jgi:RNA polymerase sigma-70 factor (ECF subfamily)